MCRHTTRILCQALLLVAVFFSGSGVGLAGIEEEIKTLREDMAAVKKDVAEIKKLLQNAIKGRGQGPTKTTAEVSLEDRPAMGSENAPVTMVEFSDYQCPFCRRFATTVFQTIKREYIDTGKVRYVFRDFPLSNIHPQALKAHESAHCAREQHKYWEMHDLLFQDQKKLPSQEMSQFAEQVGLDVDTFTHCLESGKYGPSIQKDIADGSKAGVRGTPSFVIGKSGDGKTITGTLVRGAQPLARFKEAIEAAQKPASGKEPKPSNTP